MIAKPAPMIIVKYLIFTCNSTSEIQIINKQVAPEDVEPCSEYLNEHEN